ncbi:MAG: hypothetical protein BWY63_03027 [Chloroflexi bacterium ADurb.Bin360]|nr:MAG: hypothetical protein BWY63_03027 [Chloroflexi bacterium ADurb.Bin360]
MNKDSLTPYFSSRNPGRFLTRQWHPPVRNNLGIIIQLTRRINARETDQRTHLTQPFHQHYPRQIIREPQWNGNLPQSEVIGIRAGSRMGQNLPLRTLEVAQIDSFTLLITLAFLLNSLPELRVCVTMEITQLS